MDSRESFRTCETPRPSKGWIGAGIFIFVLAIYVLSSPGRIDLIDGQARYEVTYNWLVEGRPVLRDPWIKPWMAVSGRRGLPYSGYGAPASVFSMPLVWLGLLADDPPGEPSRFLFSLTSSVFGALIAVVLYLFYIELGLAVREALVWTMVNAFTTLVWPISNSTFDNVQHAFFAISGVYLGHLSAKRKSRLLAAAGGMVAGVLILYQEYFLLLIPALALCTLDWPPVTDHSLTAAHKTTPKPLWAQLSADIRNDIQALVDLVRSPFRGRGEARESCVRLLCFLTTVGVGLALSFAYNDLRFGSFLDTGKLRFVTRRAYPLLGNPLAGFVTLLLSPGKSVFLYSPPLILGVLGIRHLWRRKPEVGTAIVAASTILLLFISCISFAGGDWCWGPRYLVVLLPLWALAFPFMVRERRLQRNLVVVIVGLGLVVQVLALSIEHQRFFFQRGLNDFFWSEDPWFYCKHSALFARVSEVISLKDGLPPTAQEFNAIPIPEWSTYTILGPPPKMPRSLAPQWMRHFKIFYLPRPWPIWMWQVKPDLRPISLEAWLAGLCGLGLLGITLVVHGFRTWSDSRATQDVDSIQKVGHP